MPVWFGLFVRWLESSNYLFVKIQLLSTSFATEYFHTFKTLVTTFILWYVYIFICNNQAQKLIRWITRFYVVKADGQAYKGQCWTQQSTAVYVCFGILSLCFPRLSCILTSISPGCFLFLFSHSHIFFLSQKKRSKNRGWRDGSAV